MKKQNVDLIKLSFFKSSDKPFTFQVKIAIYYQEFMINFSTVFRENVDKICVKRILNLTM